MRYDYQCHECGTINELDVMLSEKPSDWQPPSSVKCTSCGHAAPRTFGCSIGVQNDSDETKHVGKSTSASSGFQFIGDGFPDVDRRLQAEQKEIEALMDEPPTREEIAAGNQQMAELELERGKPKGSISGDREVEEVEIVGVSDDEARRVAADEQQRLAGNMSRTLEESGVSANDAAETVARRVKVAAGDIDAVKDFGLEAPLAEGQKIIKKVHKRRGKEKLKEEMQDNRANRK